MKNDNMKQPLPDACLDQLFRTARTANAFQDRPIPAERLRKLYDLAKMGPTSMNTQPARFVFVASAEAKARLLPAISPGNVEKTRTSPVTVIVATDTRFHEYMPTIWHQAGAREKFEGNPALATATSIRNSTLGGAWLILAARALGLDCGPMSGFDGPRVNAEFFPDGRWQANFLVNLGVADVSAQLDRNPRLAFDDAALIL